MTKCTTNFMKGLGAGMVAGMAAAVAGKMVLENKRSRRALAKGTGKAFRAVGDFVEGVQTLLK